jgi:outer membrane immunogenic protein
MRVKQLVLTSAFAVLALSSASYAADFTAETTAVYEWSGFYAGLNAGYGFGGTTVNVTQNPNSVLFGADPFDYKINPAGFIGGAQVGYNYQVNAFVFGVEGDFQFSSIKKTDGIVGLPLNPSGSQPISASETKSTIDYFGTLRARLGYTPTDRFMIYGTGGLIFANVQNESFTQYNNAIFDPSFRYVGSESSLKTGFVIGAGTEYAFTNKITAKLEYLYYDLGKQTYTGTPLSGVSAFSVNYQTKNVGNIVRVGLNYKF